VNSLEIAALVAKSYLPEETKSDPKAIKAAIEPVVCTPFERTGSWLR
jgi:hypothetical protein